MAFLGDFLATVKCIEPDLSSPMGTAGMSIVEETTGCLVSSSSVCVQIFVVTIPSDIDCVTSSGDEVVDLSGVFETSFVA